MLNAYEPGREPRSYNELYGAIQSLTDNQAVVSISSDAIERAGGPVTVRLYNPTKGQITNEMDLTLAATACADPTKTLTSTGYCEGPPVVGGAFNPAEPHCGTPMTIFGESLSEATVWMGATQIGDAIAAYDNIQVTIPCGLAQPIEVKSPRGRALLTPSPSFWDTLGTVTWQIVF